MYKKAAILAANRKKEKASQNLFQFFFMIF